MSQQWQIVTTVARHNQLTLM